MQGLEKCDQRGGLRGAQILAVRRHVATALNHLADELVLRQPHRNTVECRTALPTALSEGMAVAALFDLKHERALPFQGGRSVQELRRHGSAAPGIHLWTPRRIPRKMRKGPESDGN